MKERASLAASLWESIGDPNTSELSDEESIDLALSRDAEIESGDVKPITHLIGCKMDDKRFTG